jgi:hypothetical protein
MLPDCGVGLQQVRAELDRDQRALQAALILERLQDVADRLVSWILPVSAANPAVSQSIDIAVRAHAHQQRSMYRMQFAKRLLTCTFCLCSARGLSGAVGRARCALPRTLRLRCAPQGW